MRSPITPWKRILGATIAGTVRLAIWAVPAAILLTGVGLWLNWHALARGGVDATGVIQECALKRSGGIKIRSGTSFYACTYTYRTTPDGPPHSGYLQTQRERRPGDEEAIRFLADRAEVSAATETLRHWPVTAGGLVAVGLALLVWVVRVSLKTRAQRTSE